MNRFVFANSKLCIGCDTCLTACAEIHQAEGLQPLARLSIVRNGDISTPIACRQCENAPCVKVCPVNAITMSENAIVLNEASCIGCKLCVLVCPFGVIALSGAGVKGNTTKQNQKTDEAEREADPSAHHSLPSPEKEMHRIAVKCDLCNFSAHGPECVRACPTDALLLVDEKTLKRSSSAKRKAAVKNMSLFLDNSKE